MTPTELEERERRAIGGHSKMVLAMLLYRFGVRGAMAHGLGNEETIPKRGQTGCLVPMTFLCHLHEPIGLSF